MVPRLNGDLAGKEGVTSGVLVAVLVEDFKADTRTAVTFGLRKKDGDLVSALPFLCKEERDALTLEEEGDTMDGKRSKDSDPDISSAASLDTGREIFDADSELRRVGE